MIQPEQQKLVEFTVGMYARVRSEWERVRASLPATGHCGFSILGSPPEFRPGLMIIGINPSVGRSDPLPNIPDGPPEETDARDAQWDFAKTLRLIFDKADASRVLQRATLANFLFFKARCVEKKGGEPLCWADNFDQDAHLRTELEDFCLREILEYVRLAEPERIMVSGLGVFDARSTGTTTVLRTEHDGKQRRLLVTGSIAGRPAFGIPHHTGSRPPVQVRDWDRVADWIGRTII
jgi:hypothetical protein